MGRDRTQRLARLLTLQQRLKALHEARQAMHLSQAAEASREAAELAREFDLEDSLSALFPELYHARIKGALTRQEECMERALQEAAETKKSDARAGAVERAYREAMQLQERDTEEATVLEMLQQRLKPGEC